MAKKKVKKAPAMHKMPSGAIMKDSEMEAHDEDMMGKYKARLKKGKYRKD